MRTHHCDGRARQLREMLQLGRHAVIIAVQQVRDAESLHNSMHQRISNRRKWCLSTILEASKLQRLFVRGDRRRCGVSLRITRDASKYVYILQDDWLLSAEACGGQFAIEV